MAQKTLYIRNEKLLADLCQSRNESQSEIIDMALNLLASQDNIEMTFSLPIAYANYINQLAKAEKKAKSKVLSDIIFDALEKRGKVKQ